MARRALWALVAVPPLALATALAALVTGVGPVRDGFWPRGPLTLPEAVATKDTAALLEQLRRGADPAAAYDTRPGTLNRNGARVTAFEAAALANRGDMLGILLDEGARLPAAHAPRVACLAARGQADTVIAVLRSRLGIAPPDECAAVLAAR